MRVLAFEPVFVPVLLCVTGAFVPGVVPTNTVLPSREQLRGPVLAVTP